MRRAWVQEGPCLVIDAKVWSRPTPILGQDPARTVWNIITRKVHQTVRTRIVLQVTGPPDPIWGVRRPHSKTKLPRHGSPSPSPPCIRRRGMKDNFVLFIHSPCILPFWKPWDPRRWYMHTKTNLGLLPFPWTSLNLLKVPPETTWNHLKKSCFLHFFRSSSVFGLF